MSKNNLVIFSYTNVHTHKELSWKHLSLVLNPAFTWVEYNIPLAQSQILFFLVIISNKLAG